MRCACCGTDQAAACFSGSQRRKPAASRKCTANITGNLGGNTSAPPLGAGGAAAAAAAGSVDDAGAHHNPPPASASGGSSTGTSATGAGAEAAAAAAHTSHSGTPTPSPEPPLACSWAACGRLLPDPTQRRRCGRCKNEFYCDRACQKEHWGAGGHKEDCEEPPCCTLCLDGGDEPLPVQRGCACRGDVGLAHAACLDKMNAHTAEGYHNGWRECPTCGQHYTGAMELALARALVYRLRRRRRDDNDRLRADHVLGNALEGAGECVEAITYEKQGRLAEAEELQAGALAASERVRGTEHPKTLWAAGNLAWTYFKQGKLTEAEELQAGVLTTSERVLGKNHPDTVRAAGNLAAMCDMQGRFAEAEELLAGAGLRRQHRRAGTLNPHAPALT